MSKMSKVIVASRRAERKIERFIDKTIASRGWRKIIVKRLGKNRDNLLTKEQIREIKSFYSPYAKVTPIFHKYYYKNTHNYDKRYVPGDLYFTEIDYYFNDWEQAHFFDNKCLYEQLFPGIPQVRTIAYRVNNMWQKIGGGGISRYIRTGVIHS